VCGIVGAFGCDERLQESITALMHRGPNGSGTRSFTVGEKAFTLGHTRLSIIDLSDGGRQPMTSSDGRHCMSFNGEIYNYREIRDELARAGIRFITESDTEVLLAAWNAWGLECLPRLVGMFAFAVFDTLEQRLTLVRDRFGIKPLYYRTNETGGLMFASEIPALLRMDSSRPRLNHQAVYDFLVQDRYDAAPSTFWSDVMEVPPGHAVSWHLPTMKSGDLLRWWKPRVTLAISAMTFAEAAERTRELLLENVRLHLRSDVPVVAALSGGIDSSAIVCMMRHLEPTMDIHSFSFIPRGARVSEESWVDIVNTHAQAMPHKVIVEPHDLASDLDDLIRTQGVPFGSTSIYAQYRVFKAAREAGIIVTLDGQGADELFAGYHGYPSAVLKSHLANREFLGGIAWLSRWSTWPGRGWKKSLIAAGGAIAPEGIKNLAHRMVGNDPHPTWLSLTILESHGVEFVDRQKPYALHEWDYGVKGRFLPRRQRFALENGELNALLRHGDRNSMRWSVESRVPFLTTELADFALSLPEEYLMSYKGETKHVLRAALRGLVPDAILDRRDKVAFETPEATWLSLQRDQVMGWLSGLEALDFIQMDAARTLVRGSLANPQKTDARVWRLLNLSRWAQLYL
jgi:asparagine synthase (glutamine-hydrolysing)